MSEIKPFRAWRYNPELSQNIDELCSPLFDVVSEKQRNKLYQNEFNSIHLTLPKGDNAITETGKLLEKWKSSGVLIQDPLPAIYVYYQYFRLGGSGSKEFCRKGFICNIKTYDWPEKQILRHENTIPNAVNDRIELLRSTKLNASPTHGLYSDPAFELEKYMDESMRNPIYETEDYQGVRDVLSIIHDADIIKKFIKHIGEKKIILADGHHRYEASLTIRKEEMKANPLHNGSEPYNFHMMYLTNMESEDIRILPTHRLIANLKNFVPQDILKKIGDYFIIKEVDNVFDINEIILGKKWAFGLIFKDEAFNIRLKPEAIDNLKWGFPWEVKELDLTVLHYFVIEKVLGIPGKDQRASENISFERNFTKCITKVQTNEAQMALITQDISIEDIKKVCFSGYTLPQKSTYFYPKVVSGYLFSSIKDDEFELFPCIGF